MKKIAIITLLMLALLVLGACSSGNTGTLIVQLTDAPANVEKAMVTISQVQVHMAGGEENATTGWETIVSSSQTFDLIQLKDIKTTLGQKDLAPGKYTQIRLTVEKAVVTIDGVEQDLTIPSGVVKLTSPFEIMTGKTTALTLDFNAQDSIKETGKGNYVMQPTIKVLSS